MSSTMTAAVWQATDKVQVTQVPTPEVPQGWALVKIAYNGICGTDLAILHGKHPRATAPLIMGHEISGWVERAGATGPAAGTLVTVEPLISCGECRSCKNGLTTSAGAWACTASTPPAAWRSTSRCRPRCCTPCPTASTRVRRPWPSRSPSRCTRSTCPAWSGRHRRRLRRRPDRDPHRSGRPARGRRRRGHHRAQPLAPRGRRRTRLHRGPGRLHHGRHPRAADRRRGRGHHLRLRGPPVGRRRARRGHPRAGAHRRRRRVQAADPRWTCRPSASRSRRSSGCACTPPRTSPARSS